MTNVRTIRRQSIRAPYVDYADTDAYFVTPCAHEMECAFGAVANGAMRLNPFGEIVREEWMRTATLRPYVRLGAYVVMPNHFHGVVIIERRGDACVAPGERTNVGKSAWGDARVAPTGNRVCRPDGRPRGPEPRSLSSIVGSFKSAVTRRIHAAGGFRGWPVWQRNFYEHVIRNDADMDRIREYIATNVARWVEKHAMGSDVGATRAQARLASPQANKPTSANRRGATHASPLRGNDRRVVEGQSQ